MRHKLPMHAGQSASRVATLSVFLAFVVPVVGAQELTSPRVYTGGAVLDSFLLRITQATEAAVFNESWLTVDSLIGALREERPNSALVRLLEAARLQAEMFSKEENAEEGEFNALLDTAQTTLERELVRASSEDSAALYYFIGTCHAHRALWESKFGSIFKAVKQGFRARDSYESGLAADSSFHDLHTGRGAYRYWKSAKGGFLRWTGIISDERESGLAEVRMSIDSARISPDGARSALIWILINEKRYSEAAELARKLHERYPGGTTFLWPLAECYRKLNKHSLALGTYLKLREKLLPEPGNQVNLIKVDYEILVLARILEDDSTIQLVAAGFDEYSKSTPRKTRRKLGAKYRSLKRL